MLSEINKLENEMKEFANEIYPELNIVFIQKPSFTSTTSGIYSSFEKKIQLNWSIIESNLEILKNSNPNYTLENLSWIVFTHELGHHVDFINDKFSSYLEASNAIWGIVIQGDKYKIKKEYKRYFEELINIEIRAWDYGEVFLPPFVDKNILSEYRKKCLDSYIQGFKSGYRSFYIKTDIAKWIKRTLDANPNYSLDFDDYGETRLDSENRIFFLNVSNQSKRRNSFINARPVAESLSIQIFDKLLNLEGIDYPFFAKSEDELIPWFAKEKERIQENIDIIVSNFCYDKNFISLYREVKEEELQGVLEIKQNFFEHMKNKSLA